MVNFGPLAAEIGPVVWSTPANLNGFRVLAALLHGSPVLGVSQTLRRWTEGATYIQQGVHRLTFSYFVSLCYITVRVWHCHWRYSFMVTGLSLVHVVLEPIPGLTSLFITTSSQVSICWFYCCCWSWESAFYVGIGCSLWTRKANTASDNGVFYAITSESECMAECLTSVTCLAFDLSPVGCMLHNNADDLATAYYMPGVTQFVLNRHCLPAGLITLITVIIVF